MLFCPRYQTVLTAEQNGNHYIYKPRCKQWKCPYCAIVNRKIWRSRIMNEIQQTPAVKTWYFYTFTLLGKDHRGLKHSLSIWRETWSKLRKRMKRDLGKYRYVRVFEMHKDETLHVHMIADKSYDDCKMIIARHDNEKDRRESDKLRGHLNDLSLGYIHDIKIVETPDESENGVARNVSAYITKYMTKDIQNYTHTVLKDSGMRLRVIQASYKWFNKEKEETKLVWTRIGLMIEEYLKMTASKTATDITTKRLINIDDFYDHDYYPNSTSDLVDRSENDDTL